MKRKDVVPPAILGTIALLVWEFSCKLLRIPDYLLPAPSKIAHEIFMDFPSLLGNATITVGEAVLGFLIANLLAIGASICMVYIRYIDRALMPFAIALKTTPIVALAPLLLLWLGSGVAPKVASAALICFFPAPVNS